MATYAYASVVSPWT